MNPENEFNDRLIRLQHGEAVRFGPEGSQGLRFGRYGSLEAVDVAGADPDSLLTHVVFSMERTAATINDVFGKYLVP